MEAGHAARRAIQDQRRRTEEQTGSEQSPTTNPKTKTPDSFIVLYRSRRTNQDDKSKTKTPDPFIVKTGNGNGDMLKTVVIYRSRSCLAATRLFLWLCIAGTCWSCSATSMSPETPPDKVCDHRLARLAKAIAEYKTKNGYLPQRIISRTGHSHSWRILIAPYLMSGNSQRFAYRVDELWSSPHNRQQFLNCVPCAFACPLEATRIDYPFVSYLMLDRTKKEDFKGESGEVFDGSRLPDDAVLIVESAFCEIECGEPRDIELESLFAAGSPFGVGRLNSLHPKVVKAIRVDGELIEIPKDLPKEELRKLLAGNATPQ